MTRLSAHVARLAQSDQVIATVGLWGACKLAEWPNVVYGQTLANIDAAVSAVAVLFDNDLCADALPVTTAVGHAAANPIGRIRSGAVLSPEQRFASKRAKLPSVAAADSPSGFLEVGAALFALEPERRLPHRIVSTAQPRRASVFAWRSTGRVEPNGVFFSETCTRTEPSSVPMSKGHSHDLAANRARLRSPVRGHHSNSVPAFGGAGTTGLVADRLGRDCTLVELNPVYAEMARERIVSAAPLFADVA